MVKSLNGYDLVEILFIFFKISGIGAFAGFSWWLLLIPATLEVLHNLYLYYALTKGWQRSTIMLIMAKAFNIYWKRKTDKIVKQFTEDDKAEKTN
jgi:hypothetical protein